MKDIPFFPTEYGVASLDLHAIAGKQTAYVRVLQVQPGELAQLLKECLDFCRTVGAERVFACGHEELESYPLAYSVLQMRGPVDQVGEQALLFPVTEKTASRWREVYNRRMDGVSGVRSLSWAEEKRIAGDVGTYFVHEDGKLLGIGWVEENRLLAIASVVPGSGEIVARTLLSVMDTDTAVLDVASDNLRARRLYERMGFLVTGESDRWFQVFPTAD